MYRHQSNMMHNNFTRTLGAAAARRRHYYRYDNASKRRRLLLLLLLLLQRRNYSGTSTTRTSKLIFLNRIRRHGSAIVTVKPRKAGARACDVVTHAAICTLHMTQITSRPGAFAARGSHTDTACVIRVSHWIVPTGTSPQ